MLDDARAPDFARTIHIHRKPGHDPAELFIDPALSLPTLRIARLLLRKKPGFRALLAVPPRRDAGPGGRTVGRRKAKTPGPC